MKKYYFSLLLFVTALVVNAYNPASTLPNYRNNESGSVLLPVTAAETEGETIVITPNQVGPSTYGRQVSIRQVNAFNGTIIDIDGEQCLARITYTPYLPTVLCWSYDIAGVVQNYVEDDQTVYYLAVTNILVLHHGHNDTADIKRINSLFNLKDEAFNGQYFDLTGHFTTPLTAVYQNDQYLYVRDVYGDYGLVDGDITCLTTNGDLIHDAKAKPYNYDGINVIIPEDPSSFTPDGHQAAVKPGVFTINNLSNEMIHHYVRFNGVEINFDDDGNFQAIADDTGILPIHNKFGIGITELDNERYDLNDDGEVTINDINVLINRILSDATSAKTAIDNEGYDVTGFMSIKDSELALIPIKIVHHVDPSLAGDLNGDGEENIADINIIIDYITVQ